MTTDIADLAATLVENDSTTLAGRAQIARDKRDSKLRHRKFDFQRVIKAANVLGVEYPQEGNELVTDMLVANFLSVNLTRLALNAAERYGSEITPELSDDFARYMIRVSPTILGESDVWRITEMLRAKQETAYSEDIVLRSARSWFNGVRPLGESIITFVHRGDLIMDIAP